MESVKKVSAFISFLKTTYLLLIFSTVSYAQIFYPPSFEHIALDKGLSQGAINAMLQDSKGFMWFGTIDGLNMYDGYTFTVYRNNINNSTSLSDNWITAIYEDSEHNLWIGTAGGGLNKFNPATEKFTAFKNNPGDENSICSNSIRTIFEDKDKNFYIGTRGGGIDIFNRRTKTFSRLVSDQENPSRLGSKRIRAMIEDNDGNIWIGTDKGLCVFNKKLNTFRRYISDSLNTNSLSSNSVRAIYEDKNGIIWIGTRTGLNKFDKKNNIFKHFLVNEKDNFFKFENISVNTITEADSGVLWIGTWEAGLIRFNKIKEQFIPENKQNENLNRQIPNSILTTYNDRNGNIWVGTFFTGIYKYSHEKSSFVNYANNPAEPNSVSNSITWGMYEDKDGYIWIGTAGGGLNRFDRRTSSFKVFKKAPTKKRRASENHIMYVTGDSKGNLWLSSWGSGLSKFNSKTGTFKDYMNDPDNPNTISSNYVRYIYPDESGILFIGTTRGLNLFDPVKNKFTIYRHNPDDLSSLSEDRIDIIYKDKKGIYWIGTQGGGLNKFDVITGKFKRFEYSSFDRNSLSNDRVKAIYEDTKGILWIGTDNGLNRFDPAENKFKRFSSEDGLPNDAIYGIIPDEIGNLWMSTNKGISRFNPYTEEFRNYDIRDGLPANEYNVQSYLKTKSGEMLFGSNNGFTIFHPGKIAERIPNVPVVITAFRIFDKAAKKNLSLSNYNEVSLYPEQNFFAFEFAALNFNAAGKNSYAYKLAGFDKDWVYCGERRYASYTNLNPGTYYFYVISSFNEKEWSKPGTPVKLVIYPPFWRTWWFTTLSLLLFFALLYAAHLFRVKSKIKQVLEIENVRRGIADDFHDELGHKLTKISLYSSLIKKNIPDEEDYVSKIHSTASTLFNDTKDFIWSVDPGKDSFYDLAVYIKDFGDALFQNTSIAFDVDEIPEELQTINLPMEWKRQIILIFKEGMNNILKHSQCSNVYLTASFRNELIEIILNDDGKGIPKNSANGRGLLNMRSRAEKIGGILFIESAEGNGTTIIFSHKIIRKGKHVGKRVRLFSNN